MAPRLTAQNRKWQQESDAHTLAEAEKIKSDKNRLGGAKKAAQRMAVDAQKSATSLKKVASSPTRKKPPTARKPAARRRKK